MPQSKNRTADDARAAFQTCQSSDPKDRVEFYDSWAQNYETDSSLMNYRSPHLGVEFLSEHFCGSREEAVVLDVACGSGWVAKLMSELGFRHFVGTDGSKGMLELAAQTGLYQELTLALLGPQPLPAQTETFDVVMMVGCLDVGFAPVSVVRELCNAAKPGGLICMTRGDHRGSPSEQYKVDLEAELSAMEDSGLWSQIGVKGTDRYMEDPHLNRDTVKDMEEDDRFLSGTAYLYKKATH